MEKLKSFPFMEKRKIYYIVTLVLIIASIATGLIRGYNFGIDFTGGTLMQIEMGKEVKISEINDILSDQKIDGNVTHAGDGNTQIIIKTTDSMESDTRTALMSALKEKYGVTDDAVLSIENIGPSVGETLKSSAFKATAIAIVLMLIYIAVRFMWKYGIAAIIALANTVLLVIGFYGVFHISINSPFIAAILTILGYGINDTIVIFDRIRENTDNSARRSANGLAPLVDLSIKQTLGRSIMTSLTTVIVMVPLLIFCGDTIRSFILPILVGVICSTCSSIFIATSVWYDIMKSTDRSSYHGKAKKNK
ncbi:MAG: protein translocase subunit SecF [Anaerovoracaceae bacterium]|nr:protein translocase subunit SecF [Bacillota bacterium]MDD7733903.1 protein translocase subunit SecF [Bacillota bacterium]MDY5905726.1 protein translocase subunit SecF [Anaerovoracaceae bacterium]